MPVEGRVLGMFEEPAGAARAVRALRAARFEVETAMPAPFPEVIAALGKPRSGLGAVTFSGALLGLLAGALLTVGTSLAWPLVTGGKPIVSVPPFVIVVFEVTVLAGSLTNLAAVVAGAALGARRQATAARVGGTGDRIAVVASAGEASAARRILRESGAEEVRDVA